MKDCNSCGKCCTKYSNGGLSATASEIEFWDICRPEIARYVDEGEIWMNPDDGRQLALCPWLNKVPGEEKYLCGIYYDRPDDCKHYPVTIEQMMDDECEMLEVKDLRNPRQAQKDLDKLMADSRPALEQ
ncbi:zinc/iron-chelating domain-containing protein [Gammaproteobacteria bacterium 53_120_T64]|nr:zinc/iron-chelating domain-containing protein [Gammaproteobacteria bacterium 53_120_T64]